MSTIDQAKIGKIRQPKTDILTIEPRRQPVSCRIGKGLLNTFNKCFIFTGIYYLDKPHMECRKRFALSTWERL